MERTFNTLCQEMLMEWFGDRKHFKKIFDSSVHSDPIPSFHSSCDKIGPSVTVFYSSDDSMFGGYTSRNWQSRSNEGAKRDRKAFLFKLYDQNTFQAKKYPIDYPRCAIYCHGDYGPTFGGTSDDLYRDIETKRNQDLTRKGTFTVTTALGHSYSTGKISNEDFTCLGGKVKRFEVFQVIDDDEYIETPWRNVTNVSVESLKKELKVFHPPTSSIDYANILLVGQIGAGKSSYLNSVISAFKGHVSSSVCTGSATTSLTLKNEEHKVFIWPERTALKFRFWDTRGIEQPLNQSQIDDIIHIIEGRPPGLMDQLRVWFSTLWYGKAQPIQSEQEMLQEKVHCVAFVIDGSVLSVLPRHIKEALGKIKTFAVSCGIPQMVLLTKIDKVCPMVDKHLSLTFHSKTIQKLVDEAAELIGLPRTHVCPVKNYEQECELEEDVDRLTLLSLRQMLRFADDHLCKFI